MRFHFDSRTPPSALKPLQWYEYCARAFPTARYYAIADDDTYLQLDHFEADVRSLRAAADALVLWGLVMWYGAYDNSTMVPHEAWGGWAYTDAGAVKTRAVTCTDTVRAHARVCASLC